jgi:hypothetical protein
MSARQKYFSYFFVALTAASFLMAYFVKPHPFNADIVLPETSFSKGVVSSPRTLAERVAQSYNLAFVIVKSEFSETNANALESLRNWASKNFQHDANFLHPASLELRSESNQSIIDSFSYSILATTHYFLAQQVAEFLQWRIDDFRRTDSYKSFTTDFYNVFGQDADAAALLARYQSYRAKEAIDPLLCAGFWLVLGCFGLVIFSRSKADGHATKEQLLLAYIWIALSLFYIVSGWIQNQVPILISAIICGAIGLYIRRPVRVNYGENHGLSFELIRLSWPAIALLYWITISMFLIRIVSWIKTGSLVDPDPVTLMICSFTGDFLHDPADIKRNIDRVIGVIWTLLSLWTVIQLAEEPEEFFDQEEDLAFIQKSFMEMQHDPVASEK